MRALPPVGSRSKASGDVARGEPPEADDISTFDAPNFPLGLFLTRMRFVVETSGGSKLR